MDLKLLGDKRYHSNIAYEFAHCLLAAAKKKLSNERSLLGLALFIIISQVVILYE